MKKLLSLFVFWALASALLFTTSLTAGDHLIVKIGTDDTHACLVVQLANLEQQTAEIDIQALDGKVWFYQFVVRKDGFATRYNLEGMPDADYIVFVRLKEKYWTRAFSLSEGAITFFDDPNTDTPVRFASTGTPGGKIVAKFSTQGDKVMRLQLANLRNEDSRVSIVALGHDLMYTTRVRSVSGFETALSFEALLPGRYCAYVDTPFAAFVQFMDLDEQGIDLGRMLRLDKASGPAVVPPVPGDILATR